MRLTAELTLRASRSEVWAVVSTVGGINREVAPFVRMTDPTDGAPFDAEPWRLGAPVSWQLLLGVIPIDRHRVELVALPDGRGFRESSSSWWHRVWWHERTLLDDPGGRVVQRLSRNRTSTRRARSDRRVGSPPDVPPATSVATAPIWLILRASETNQPRHICR